MNLPKDPVILLSFVNTQLRDHYPSFDEFVQSTLCDGQAIIEILRGIDYEYDEAQNQFI